MTNKIIFQKKNETGVIQNTVKALLVTKTRDPVWKPDSIHDINIAEVKKLFQPHTIEIEL